MPLNRDRTRKLILTATALLTAGFVVVPASYAHTATDKQLEKVDKKIAASPDDFDLYMRRANIHRLHQDWDKALADYATAEKLGPPELALDMDFYRGQIWFDAGELNKARPALDRFIERKPDHYQARLLSARIWAALNDTDAALAEYKATIAIAADPSPGLYLERAQLQVDAGRIDAALQGIDEAVAQKGPLVTLIKFGVDTEEQRGNYLTALDWLGRLPANIRMQPKWLMRSGDLHAALEQPDAARADWQTALKRIDVLPLSRRETPANAELRTELGKRLDETS